MTEINEIALFAKCSNSGLGVVPLCKSDIDLDIVLNFIKKGKEICIFTLYSHLEQSNY